MEKVHVYYSTTICAAYTIEVPEGMDPWKVANELNNSDKFYIEHISPDLMDCDWGDIDVEIDGWTDELDFTAEQVLEYIGK